MVPVYSRIVVLIFLHSFLFSCGLAGSDDSSTVEVVYKGETESYMASNEGKLTIIGGAVLEDYEEVTFDLQINYDDGTPASNAEVVYKETSDFVILQIISDADEGGSAMMVGSPLEIKDFLEDGISSRKNQFPGSDNSIESIIGSLIIGGVIIIKKGAKIYSVYRTGQAIWNTGLEVYEVSKFFVSDAIRYEAGAVLYCKELNDLESLAQSLQYIARTTPRLIVSLKGELKDNVFEVFASDVGGRFEDYLADFVIDKTFRFYDDVYDLNEQRFGVKVYLPGSVLFPSHRGESPGFIEIIPEMDECQDTDQPDIGDWPRDTETEVVAVTNPVTGRVWMDRNLGASRAATSSTDEQAYGDLYQWGRAADGHQRRDSQTTYSLSNSDQPGHGDYILSNRNSNWDWRSPQNDDLWQGVAGINNPCPPGYRLPTSAEWDTERNSWSSNNEEGAFASILKLPLAGYRDSTGGLVKEAGNFGGFWSSSVSYSGGHSIRMHFVDGSLVHLHSVNRASGASVRCIKD